MGEGYEDVVGVGACFGNRGARHAHPCSWLILTGCAFTGLAFHDKVWDRTSKDWWRRILHLDAQVYLIAVAEIVED